MALTVKKENSIMGFLRFTKHHTKAVVVALSLAFPFVSAIAQTAPTPNNPSYSTQSKFTYGRFTQNLEVDGLLQLPAGAGGSVLGGSKYVTLDAISTLGQNSAILIPDPGAATANELLDSGVTSAITIQHIAVPLTAANIIAMYTAPVALIPAGAAGTNIVVEKVMFTMIPSGTAFTSGGAVTFTIGNTANGGGTATTGTVAATVVNASGTTTTYNTVIPVAYAGTAATGLYVSNATGVFATGTGTAVVDIWFQIK
jgi:hypothetical protein